MVKVKCVWKHPNCPAYQDGMCVALTETEFPGRYDCPFYNPKAGRSGKDPYMSDHAVENALRQKSPCKACIRNESGRCEAKPRKCYTFREWVHTSLIALRKVTGL